MRQAQAQYGEASACRDHAGLGETSGTPLDVDGTSESWKTISALAHEYTQAAVRPFTVRTDDDVKSGNVKQESEVQPDSQLPVNQYDPDVGNKQSQLTEAEWSAAVSTEAKHVSDKVVPLNLETEVVVRFDFITNRDSRVGCCVCISCLSRRHLPLHLLLQAALITVAAAEILGIVVLVTEFSVKLKEVSRMTRLLIASVTTLCCGTAQPLQQSSSVIVCCCRTTALGVLLTRQYTSGI